MKIYDILKQFDQLINYSLYTNSSLNDEYNNLLNELIKSIENSKNILEDVTLLSSNQTHENYFQYTNMISSIIEKAKLNYEQIKLLVDNSEYNLTAILKFDEDEFINFLESKNKITKKDIRDINYYLNKNNTTINRIFASSDIINKLPNHSLNINDFTNLGKINYDELKKINKKDVSSYLLHFYKDFKEFKQFIMRNDEIWTLIDDSSLVFNNEYDKDVIEYIQNNKNTITKFNSYYLTLLDNEEIIRCFKNGFTNSYILKTMYSSNHENANDIFSTKNILKCQKNSIDFLPYNDLDNKIIIEILENIDLLNRFNDYVIAELINNYLNEDERISLLRKQEFLDSINSYTIELIVNNLSFKSLFNMIQNHSIFNRIQNLNSKITINDKIFVRGFLDSTILVYKSNKEMIIKLLLLLDSDKVLDYLSLPYILDKLTSNEIITIINKQYINFDKVIDEDNIFNKLTSVSIADYINTLWEDKVDLALISKPKVLRKIFNLDENILNRINIDEINYLFEAIRTKDILSIQDKKYTVMTYRSVIAAYMCLGISRTLELINNGNNDIDLDDTKEVLNSITYHNLIKFRNNNYSILQNIDKKIVDNLKDIEFIGDIKEFSKELLFNGYISSIISLMVSTEYAPFFEIVNILYNYRKYDKDENARKELRDFCNKFSSYCINKKKIEFITSLEVIARNDYDLKKSFKCSEYSKISSDFLNKLKLKLFIKILNGENKEKLQYAFRDGTDLDTIKDKFIKYLGNNDIDIDSIIKYILVPLSKDKFNEIECLKNIGIDKPRDYDLYIRNINDINTVNEINCFISQIKDIYDSPTIIEILNYICHGTTIKSKIDRKMKKQLKELQFKAFEVLGEMYVDISTYSLIYTNTIDIDDEEEIIEYINYLDIITEIKNKTTNYLNRHMNSNNIKLHHMNEYMKNTKLDNIKYPFISKYFESKKRLFTLNDLEMIFMGYDFNKGYELDEHLEDFLFSRDLIKYIALGYYKDQISNFGYIISKLIKKDDVSLPEGDYSSLCASFIKHPHIHPDYLQLIWQGIDGMNRYVKDYNEKLKLLAKSIYDETTNTIINNQGVRQSVSFLVTTSHQQFKDEVSNTIAGKGRCYPAFVDAEWLHQNREKESALNYLLFDENIFTRDTMFRAVNNKHEDGLTDFFGVKAKDGKEYRGNTLFEFNFRICTMVVQVIDSTLLSDGNDITG